MLDLFTIFSKGGIVLWYFQGTTELFTQSINELIKSVILQERGLTTAWNHNTLSMQYKLDNEFELVFVVAYQNIVRLTYVDKFLDEIQLRFRDKYKSVIQSSQFGHDFDAFRADFDDVLRQCEHEARLGQKTEKKPRSYEESSKANKTVGSMIETKKGGGILGSLLSNGTSAPTTAATKKANKKSAAAKKAAANATSASAAAALDSDGGGNDDENDQGDDLDSPDDGDNQSSLEHGGDGSAMNSQKSGGEEDDSTAALSPSSRIKRIMAKGPKKFEKKAAAPSSPKNDKAASAAAAAAAKGKKATKWVEDVDQESLNYSNDKAADHSANSTDLLSASEAAKYGTIENVGKMRGELRGIEEVVVDYSDDQQVKKSAASSSSSSTSGFFSSLKGLVGSKVLTKETIQPVMDKMQDHLIAKNVAAEIAMKICDNVAQNLEGKQISSFQFVTNIVKQALQESMIQILTPKKRVDILRDVYEAQRQKRPYVIVFCGVNGVGKSTNLAKVTFWLIENSFRVLIAACDTFRSGAVEQLRTHTKHLNNLHPAENHDNKQMVELFEKGYGKDAAAIANEAINYAKDKRYDVVLVDTAGRMQDNEPLMKALAKLININNPDLVLFVGEALVGNEAVDQVKKFNQALVDNSLVKNSSAEQARTIDGIVLTKFDTIDDKVGAAISMTYTTGQPIVFVGTGQTYTDLKSLNVQSVVHSLLR